MQTELRVLHRNCVVLIDIHTTIRTCPYMYIVHVHVHVHTCTCSYMYMYMLYVYFTALSYTIRVFLYTTLYAIYYYNYASFRNWLLCFIPELSHNLITCTCTYIVCQHYLHTHSRGSQLSKANDSTRALGQFHAY